MDNRARTLLNFKRMCDSYENCGDCKMHEIIEDGHPLFMCNVIKNPDKAVEITEQWALNNPLKTRQYYFLKQHPNTATDSSGTIRIPPCYIERDYQYSESCDMDSSEECEKCRKRYWDEVQS